MYKLYLLVPLCSENVELDNYTACFVANPHIITVGKLCSPKDGELYLNRAKLEGILVKAHSDSA